MTNSKTSDSGIVTQIGFFAGPLIAILILWIGPPAALDPGDASWSPAWVTLALLALMAIWWVTEAIPIPVTSLLPLVVLPMAGIRTIGEAAAAYMNPIVVLLMGGFIFAKAIEQWGLHERIALNVVSRAGSNPSSLVAGFMLAAAILSMWISNSATSIMMMPIALSVAATMEKGTGLNGPFTLALLLGIAYACSIGGLGTPIGTPTNLIVLGYLNTEAGWEISFSRWMMLALPVVALLLPAAWFVLTRWAFQIPQKSETDISGLLQERLSALGPIRAPEWRTIGVFIVVASLWVFRRPLNELELAIGEKVFTPFAGLTDHITAIIAVFLVFMIPAGGNSGRGKRLLDWSVAEQIPWGVLLLFGGGLSLAGAISSTGLSVFLGDILAGLAELPLPVLILIVTSAVLFLTEVTSNVATASALMPVLGALAIGSGLPMEMMAVPVAFAASCAFMLPMATGPNAVAFATGRVRLIKMARAGLRLNLLAIMIISAIAYFIAPMILG